MDNDHKIRQRFISALKKLLATPGWDNSPLLKVYYKKFSQLLQKAENDQPQAIASDDSAPDRAGQCQIYVSLFQQGGNDLVKWEAAIASLQSAYLGRPIYDQESAVRTLIESRANKVQEGYVVLWVNEQDVLKRSSSGALYDPLRQPLLTVAHTAIRPDQIERFVHANAVTYRYVNGRLVLQSGALDAP